FRSWPLVCCGTKVLESLSQLLGYSKARDSTLGLFLSVTPIQAIQLRYRESSCDGGTMKELLNGGATVRTCTGCSLKRTYLFFRPTIQKVCPKYFLKPRPLASQWWRPIFLGVGR